MAYDEQNDVHEFHLAMGVPVEEKPVVPTWEVRRLRARLVTEEFGEFIAGMAGLDPQTSKRVVVFLQGYVNGILNRAIADGRETSLPEVADSIADLKYVLEGTNLSFGIDGGDVWDEVHRANMRKLDGPRDEHGKIQKPPGWTPPDIEGVLRKQGWKG